MNPKRIIIAVVVLALLMVAIGLGKHAVDSRPKPPTPTPSPVPTATQTPPTVITCLGGQVFLADTNKDRTGIVDYLLDKYNIQAKYVSSGSFEMVNADLTNIDCVWPGSGPAANDFMAAHKDIVLKKDIVFRTFNFFLTRRDDGHDYLDAFIKAGLVYQKDGAYFMPMYPIIEAMQQHKRWSDLGVEGVPGFVNIKNSAPESSGGGMQHEFLLCAYLMPDGQNGGVPCQAEYLKPILPFLVDNWELLGGQSASSPDWFLAWLQNSVSFPLGASSESLFIGWYNKQTPENKQVALSKVVAIYPEWTIGTDHVFMALTPNGAKLLEIIESDPYFSQRAWNAYGMRTAFGGIGAKPGETDIPWMVPEPLAISEPKQDASDMITCAINPAKCK